jgi:hypothetical protein
MRTFELERMAMQAEESAAHVRQLQLQLDMHRSVAPLLPFQRLARNMCALREKLDAVRGQLQSSQSQATLEKSELKTALDAAEEKLKQLSGLEQQLGSIITDAAAAGADVQPFTDVLQAAALGSKGRVAQVKRTHAYLMHSICQHVNRAILPPPSLSLPHHPPATYPFPPLVLIQCAASCPDKENGGDFAGKRGAETPRC